MSNRNNSTPNEQCNLKSLTERFGTINLLDPRSPTTAYPRTPIQVILKNSRRVSYDECLDAMSTKMSSVSSQSFVSLSSPPGNDEESLELSASSASFLSLKDYTDLESINLSADDLSIMVSDCSSYQEEMEKELSTTGEYVTSDETDRTMEISNEQVISKETILTPENLVNPPQTDSEKNIIKVTQNSTTDSNNYDSFTDNYFENVPVIKKKLLKTQFYTPNPNKKRNPLGPVENICPTTPPSHLSCNSPQSVFCEKQWKRIQEERKKLGLDTDENVQLPLYDITASAPSKLMRRSRLRARFNIMS